jgi:hypothetical protein
MPLPTRPVSGASIESVWGQEIHDWTFAPKGADLTSSAGQTVSATLAHLNLDTATDDPGGFLNAAGDEAEVPTGGDGLYLACLSLNVVNGDAGKYTRGYLFLNGTSYAADTVENEGGLNVTITITTPVTLSAGDILQAWAKRTAAGTNPTVTVNYLRLVRIGSEYGA